MRVTEILGEYRGSYTIDVSSPGLDRPLRTPGAFPGRRSAGTSRFAPSAEIAGKKRFRGPVVAASERSVRIAVGETELDIPYETIVRGNLIDEG